jgi:hypothetical protein
VIAPSTQSLRLHQKSVLSVLWCWTLDIAKESVQMTQHHAQHLAGWCSDPRANFSIALAVAQIIEADAQARIAGAALLPTLNATADVTKSQISTTVSGNSAAKDASENLAGVDVVSIGPLFAELAPGGMQYRGSL